MSAYKCKKRILWERDNGQCFYCGVTLRWDHKTVDHVIPKSKGGPDRTWNLVICCFDCNFEKGDDFPTMEQLQLVLHRKFLHETRVSLGRKIENLKAEKKQREAERLIDVQRRFIKAFQMNPLPSEVVENLKHCLL